MEEVINKKQQVKLQEKKDWIQTKKPKRSRKVSSKKNFRNSKKPKKSKDKKKLSNN